VRTWLRLGHASLSSGAYRDAAEAFESVVSLDPEGERGQEALSLLSEAYSRTGNTPGLYKVSLQLARKADGPTAEVLYRRAADLFDDPKEVIDALLPLTRLRPADATLIDRAVEGLRALGRYAELLDVYEAGATAAGGARAAELLLAAANVAGAELADPDHAWALWQRAAEADPSNELALRKLVEGLRQRDDTARLLEALPRLVERTKDADEASLLRLELASLARTAGQAMIAREALEAVVARGPAGAGYGDALEALETLLGDEPARRAEVRVARAELAEDPARAKLLVSAAKDFEAAGRIPDALKAAKSAASIAPEVPTLRLMAQLYRTSGDAPRAAKALLLAVRSATAEQKPELLLEAAGLWEQAGDKAEALEVTERIASETPHALTPAELAERFLRLGAAARAVAVGFGPAMAAGEPAEALALADKAGDAARAREALWALAAAPDAASAHVDRLVEDLRAQAELAELLRLADLVAGRDEALAVTLRGEVLDTASAPVELRLRAFEALATDPDFDTRLTSLLPGIGKLPAQLAEAVLVRVRALPAEERIEALGAVAEGWPERRAAFLRERFGIERAEGRDEDAERTLARLTEDEPDTQARVSLRLEHGELLLSLSQKERAREAFERALTEDEKCLPAVQHLLALYDEKRDSEPFVAMASRLESLAGTEALEPYRERMADAYEALGKLADAAAQLAALPETLERLARRARLAEERGLTGEALQLRERLTDEPAVLETILKGYLDAQLIPFAVRLAERLLERQALSAESTRLVTERLSPSIEGAKLAARLWPTLLKEKPIDVDGWTLFAEALRQLGRGEAAERVDGVAAALSSSEAPAPSAHLMPLPPPGDFRHPTPPGALAVTEQSLPRLYAALRPTLKKLGAGNTQLLLDPAGGVEAYLANPDELVMGAGALACFGPVELSYLCALALSLGEKGIALARPGPAEGLEEAAVAAFRAVPASLAAGRVLARLDPDMRGGDPNDVDEGAVLSANPAFRAVALSVLELV
jgi:tetratricopeptide (TPR) repeat protein